MTKLNAEHYENLGREYAKLLQTYPNTLPMGPSNPDSWQGKAFDRGMEMERQRRHNEQCNAIVDKSNAQVAEQARIAAQFDPNGRKAVQSHVESLIDEIDMLPPSKRRKRLHTKVEKLSVKWGFNYNNGRFLSA